MNARIILVIILILGIFSCKSSENNKIDLKDFEGTWAPIEWKFNAPIITKIQIITRDNFILIAVKSIEGGDTQFLIGKTNDDHIVVYISPQEERDLDKLLDHPLNLYFDKKLNCIFFLNTMYKPSKENLVDIMVNIDNDANKQDLRILKN